MACTDGRCSTARASTRDESRRVTMEMYAGWVPPCRHGVVRRDQCCSASLVCWLCAYAQEAVCDLLVCGFRAI